MSDGTEARLIERAQKGDVSAVGELYLIHQPHVFRYVWSRVRQEKRAEDLTSEIFTRMVEHLPRYKQTGVPFRAWLFRIAHNLIVTEGQRASREISLAEANQLERMAGDDANPEQSVAQRFASEELVNAIDELQDDQREVLILRFVVGLSLKEVAAALDRSLGAVKTLQHRGTKMLHAILLRQQAQK